MADYTSVTMQYNSGAGTDAVPVWTGTAIAFGGTSGANEWRWQRTGGGGTTTTPSASWPNIIKPVSNAAVEEMWAFSADAVGVKVTTYDGTNTHPQQGRFNFDATGSPASAMQLTAFQDTANTTPTPGTQTANATDGRNIVNGQATDTSSTSYLKGTVFGAGLSSAPAQETPATATGAIGGAVTATTGSAGAVTSAAATWANWQSMQGFVQYLQAYRTVNVTTAFFWYWSLVMYIGPNMQTGNMVFVPLTLQYTWT